MSKQVYLVLLWNPHTKSYCSKYWYCTKIQISWIYNIIIHEIWRKNSIMSEILSTNQSQRIVAVFRKFNSFANYCTIITCIQKFNHSRYIINALWSQRSFYHVCEMKLSQIFHSSFLSSFSNSFTFRNLFYRILFSKQLPNHTWNGVQENFRNYGHFTWNLKDSRCEPRRWNS